jgi:hypothetical protein
MNWPKKREALGYVSRVAFAPSGGLMAVGNARGKAMLFRNNRWKN